MKKSIVLLLFTVLCCMSVFAQSTRGDELFKQAQTNLENKEYIKARYLFLQAYNAFASKNDYEKAVDAGVNAAALYHRENYYKEAFDLLSRIETCLTEGESASGKPMSALRYKTAKERANMYIKLKNAPKVKENLSRMEEIAKANPSLNTDLLYSQANYYYTFGLNSQGDAAINKLIDRYQQEKDYGKANDCYRQLIEMATRNGNARLVARTYDRYNHWSDSIRALTAQDELNVMKRKYDESLKTIEDKDGSIKVKTGIIVTLSILLAVLAGALVFGFIVLMRYVVRNRKLKKNIAVANEHNELKTQFIGNISEQMKPTLDTLDQKLPAVQALRSFSEHIQVLSDLESTLSEHYDLQDNNVLSFCEELMSQIKPYVKQGVTLSVNAPKMNAKFNTEEVSNVLYHMLYNAAMHTDGGGKITLEYKKRGAHTQQFIITDTGCGIPEEQHCPLFKPFTEVRDLTDGDGLGLPICSLKAIKLNGKLSLDVDYIHGARFILELHS